MVQNPALPMNSLDFAVLLYVLWHCYDGLCKLTTTKKGRSPERP